jgi:hypothetical protein
MYRSIEVDNFRGFCRLVMDNLSRINLVAGVNNVGKTALLEAIFIHSGAYNPSITMSLDNFRGIDRLHIEMGSFEKTPWDSLFYNFDRSKEVEISGEFEEGGSRKIHLRVISPADEPSESLPIIHYDTMKLQKMDLSPDNTLLLKLDYEESPGEKTGSAFLIIDQQGVRSSLARRSPFPVYFLPARFRIPLAEEAEKYGKLEISGKQDVLLEALRIIEPKLQRVTMVAMGGVPILYGDIGLEQMLPLSYMGDGMSRLASLILAIGNAKNGVVLVDEIENGFHHKVMAKVWSAIAKAARRFNCQVFATTHSLECIASAHKAFSEEDRYDLRVHRLDRTDDKVSATTFGQDELDVAFEMKMDIR